VAADDIKQLVVGHLPLRNTGNIIADNAYLVYSTTRNL